MDVVKAKEVAEQWIQSGKVFEDKQRTLEIKEFCEQMMLGEGQDKIIIKYWLEENEKQMEKLVELYNPLTTLAINPVLSVYRKAYQSDNIRKGLSHENEDSLNKIIEAQSRYYEEKGIDNYQEEHLLNLESIDPNAWQITEFRVTERGTDNEIKQLHSKPIVFYSDEIISYEEKHGEVEWLLTERKRLEAVQQGKRKAKEVSDFYFYAAGVYLKYSEYIDDVPENGEDIVITPDKGQSRKFKLEVFDRVGSTECPALRISNKSEVDNPSIKVPPYWDARHVLIDLINLKARLDIVIWKYVFPKVFQYAPACNHETPSGALCNNGWLDGKQGHECPKCHGSGVQLIKSPQDTIVFKIPHGVEAKELLKLSDIIYTELADISLPTWLDEIVTKALKRVYFAVFNTEMQDESKIRPETATKIFFDDENKNSTVRVHTNNISRHINKAYRLTAQYVELAESFISNNKFTKNLKLESLNTLISRYQLAKTAGLPSDIVFGIECDIRMKMNVDNPQEVANSKAWEMHKPFRSKSKEEIVVILQSRAIDDMDRLIHENFDKIKQNVSLMFDDFYKMDYTKRQEAIETEAFAVFENIKIQKQSTVSLRDAFVEEEEGIKEEENLAA